MRLSSTISDIVQIINRSHSDLQDLDHDDHTQYLNIARHDTSSRHPLSVLDTAVCSETEADNKISAHAGNASAHHTKTGSDEVFGLLHSGTDANKPAAGVAGRFYFTTDTKILYKDDGSAWAEILRGETASRLAQLAEKKHASLAGIAGDDHIKLILTTQGDVLYKSATGVVRLPAGTAGQFLQTGGAGANPVWANAAKLEYHSLNPSYHSASSASTWETWDLSGSIPAGAKAAEILLSHHGSTHFNIGVRPHGISLDRYIDMGDDGSYYTYTQMTVELDADRIIEVYTGDKSYGRFVSIGYWA